MADRGVEYHPLDEQLRVCPFYLNFANHRPVGRLEHPLDTNSLPPDSDQQQGDADQRQGGSDSWPPYNNQQQGDGLE